MIQIIFSTIQWIFILYIIGTTLISLIQWDLIINKLIKSNIVFEVGKTENFDELYKQNEIKRKEMVSIKDEKRKNLIGSIVNDINIY